MEDKEAGNDQVLNMNEINEENNKSSLSPRSVQSGMMSLRSANNSNNSASSYSSSGISSVSSVLSSHLTQNSQQSSKRSNAYIDESTTNDNDEDYDFNIPTPDPNRAKPIKYGPIATILRNYFLKDWGLYGKQTTWDVTSEFKERHRLRKERDLLKRLKDEKRERLRKEAADKKWLADNFKHKQYLKSEAAKFEKRRIESKIQAQKRRDVNWKRVFDRQTVGRVVAEAAAARREKEKKEAYEAHMEATRIANENAKKKAAEDAANLKQTIEDDEEFADNIARKFGIYEGIPQPILPEAVPGLPPKQATLLTVGWIVAEVPVDSDEESEIDKDGEDEETGGGLHGRLTADLFVYAYAEILKGKNLGEDGAKALADVLTPKTKEGHQSSNKGGKNDNKASLEPGACENATKLILRYNNLHLHGTKHIMRMFPNGALPLLQVLDLAGNKLTDSGARYVSEAMSERKALQHLKILDLSSNAITDQGGFTLASGFYVGRCKKLETIKLNDNWIGSKGILAVVRSLSTQPYKKLQLVSLRRNRLRPKMLKRLRDSDNYSKWLSL